MGPDAFHNSLPELEDVGDLPVPLELRELEIGPLSHIRHFHQAERDSRSRPLLLSGVYGQSNGLYTNTMEQSLAQPGNEGSSSLRHPLCALMGSINKESGFGLLMMTVSLHWLG